MSAAVLASLMLVSAGCSGSTDETADKAKSTASSGASSSGSTASQPPDDNGSAAAGIDAAHPPKAFASMTVNASYDKDSEATARFDVYSIKRQGKLAILTLSVTPTFDDGGIASLFELMGNHGFRPTMVDPVNLKEYRLVSSQGGMASDSVSASAHSGKAMFVWAVFAAPPASVDKVNLNVYAGVPTVVDVPVQ